VKKKSILKEFLLGIFLKCNTISSLTFKNQTFKIGYNLKFTFALSVNSGKKSIVVKVYSVYLGERFL
jgi:hypothetical protein